MAVATIQFPPDFCLVDIPYGFQARTSTTVCQSVGEKSNVRIDVDLTLWATPAISISYGTQHTFGANADIRTNQAKHKMPQRILMQAHSLPPLLSPSHTLISSPSEHLSPFLRPSVFSVDMSFSRRKRPSKRPSPGPQIQVSNPMSATAQGGNMKQTSNSTLPPKDVQVLSLIEDTLRDGNTDRMLSLSKKDSQIALNLTWDLLGTSSYQPSHTKTSPSLHRTPASRSILRRISVKLALKCNILPSSMFLMNIKRLEYDCRFGGAFADVYYAKLGDVPVALKKIRIFGTTSEKERQEKMKYLYVETLLWKGLSHPNVLPFLGVSDVFKGTICMVLLWRPTTIRQHRTNLRDEGFLSARIVDRWLHQISLGLAYLHEEGVIHGDLHGGNVLVDEKGIPQLTDFGMAVIADAMPYAYHSMHGGGAVRWTAPELLDPESAGSTSGRPTKASDVYSFACLSIKLYTGEKPFPTLSDFQVQTRVPRGERPPRPSLPEGKQMRSNMWELIESCWDSDPQARPRLRDISEQIPTAPIKTLAPTYEMVELPMKRGDQHVLRFALSENYLVILTQFSIEVYSLDDLAHHDTLDVPSGRVVYDLGVVGDTIAVCSESSTGSPGRTIHIWDLPTHHCGLFAICANYVWVNPVTREEGGDSNTDAARPTFLVWYGWSPHGIGALTSPGKSLVEPVDAVPLMDSEFYHRFSFPEEVFPLRRVTARGRHALAWCNDRKVRRWDIVDGSCTHAVDVQGLVNRLCIDPFDEGMVCAMADSQVVVWDFNDPSELHTWTLKDPNMSSKDSADIYLNHVIGTDKSGDVRIWTHDFTQSRTLSHGNETIRTFFGIQGSVITISRTKVMVRDIVTGTELQSFDLMSDHLGRDKDIWRSAQKWTWPSGRGIAVRSVEGSKKVYIWRFNEGTEN